MYNETHNVVRILKQTQHVVFYGEMAILIK